MSDYSALLELLDDIQKRVEQAKDELGRLQAQESLHKYAVEIPELAIIPPTTPDLEIVGGQVTDEFLDCCAVGDDDEYYCSGTLIAPNVVVTADHCQNITRVFLKGNDITRPTEGETLRVHQSFSHPGVDLQVLVLEQLSSVLPRPIALGADGSTIKMVTLTGFGTIDPYGTIGYGIKRTVMVPLTSFGCSEPSAGKDHGCLPGREIVAGHRGLAKDTCRGDSGGPLYITGADGRYYLLGATSRGARKALTPCGDGGIYVRVDLCLDWIRTVTGIDIQGAPFLA